MASSIFAIAGKTIWQNRRGLNFKIQIELSFEFKLKYLKTNVASEKEKSFELSFMRLVTRDVRSLDVKIIESRYRFRRDDERRERERGEIENEER